MSRIGKKPIALPAGVEVKVGDKNVVNSKRTLKANCRKKLSSLLNS